MKCGITVLLYDQKYISTNRKALGFLSKQVLIAFCRYSSFSKLLKQLLQLHWLQNSPFAKQSQ